MPKTETERSDPRCHYILRVASHIFALNIAENKIQNLNSIHDFCDTNTALLIIAKHETRNTIDITNEIRNDHAELTRVVFYKLKAAPLSVDDYRSEISVISLRGRPTDALIQSIKT
ncbi:unnamed protein product, partial [Gongylonema pulchrum]|uniref:EKC/KEOPS complex subunit cgi121 n=1 Tax=Gongylonema pulchrum TaxID=637853 RepID=A0A183DRI5_9BILA